MPAIPQLEASDRTAANTHRSPRVRSDSAAGASQPAVGLTADNDLATEARGPAFMTVTIEVRPVLSDTNRADRPATLARL